MPVLPTAFQTMVLRRCSTNVISGALAVDHALSIQSYRISLWGASGMHRICCHLFTTCPGLTGLQWRLVARHVRDGQERTMPDSPRTPTNNTLSRAQAVHKVYLGFGSNLDDRDANLRRALAALPPAVFAERISSVYDTAPLLVTEQPRFHNLVCSGRTALEPLDL